MKKAGKQVTDLKIVDNKCQRVQKQVSIVVRCE